MDVHPDIVRAIKWEPENDRPIKMRAFDEIVTGPLSSVHIERMNDGCYWMALYKDDNTRQVVVISHEGRQIVGRTEVQ